VGSCMSTLSVGDLQGLAANSNVVTVPTGHKLNVTDAAGLQIGGSAVVSAGLVHISRTTVGTAVSSVTVSGAFSSAYDNYRILITGVDATIQTNLKLTFGAASTGYYASQKYDLFDGINGIDRKNNGDSILVCVTSYNESTSTSFDVHAPNLASRTNVAGVYHSNGWTGWFGGQLATTDQYTAFTITTGTGTITGGTIDLYGYAKA